MEAKSETVAKAKSSPPAAPMGSPSNRPAAVGYKGARMYTDFTKQAYRVVLDSAVNKSDKAFPWSAGRKLAWAAAIAYVDANKK